MSSRNGLFFQHQYEEGTSDRKYVAHFAIFSGRPMLIWLLKFEGSSLFGLFFSLLKRIHIYTAQEYPLAATG
jgi:hypothetical protein